MVVGKLLLSHQLKAKSQDYTRYGSQRNSNNIKNNRSVIVANFVHCSDPKIKKSQQKGLIMSTLSAKSGRNEGTRRQCKRITSL